MIGIKAIASYVPGESIDNLQQGARFGETAEFMRDKIGALRLLRKGEHEDTSDLAVAAVNALILKQPNFDLAGVDALVVVTQNGDGAGLPHTSAIVQHKLGLPTTIAAFDISLGCSGYVYGLYVLKGFMQATGLSSGVLVTADPYSKILDPEDRVTSLLFGDAATATWLGTDPYWALDHVSFGTDGAGAEHLRVVDGTLQMNGRQVFNFAALQIAPHLKRLLESAELPVDQVDAFCVHQGSAAIVEAIARRFPEVSSRFVLDIEQTGNTVSSSIPLLLEKRAFEGNWSNLAISGFGVGLSWASALLRRQELC